MTTDHERPSNPQQLRASLHAHKHVDMNGATDVNSLTRALDHLDLQWQEQLALTAALDRLNDDRIAKAAAAVYVLTNLESLLKGSAEVRDDVDPLNVLEHVSAARQMLTGERPSTL